MELRKIASRKPVKLLTLLLTAMLIATASAAVYYSLSMQSEVKVSSPVIKFVNGTDTPGPSTVNDAWCLLKLKSYPNATLTYDQAINISNTDISNSHQFKLKHSSVSPNATGEVGNWTYVKFIIYDENGTLQASLNYTVNGNNWTTEPASGETGDLTIPANTEWMIKVITLSPAGATVDEVCAIKISVDVDE